MLLVVEMVVDLFLQEDLEVGLLRLGMELVLGMELAQF